MFQIRAGSQHGDQLDTHRNLRTALRWNAYLDLGFRMSSIGPIVAHGRFLVTVSFDVSSPHVDGLTGFVFLISSRKLRKKPATTPGRIDGRFRKSPVLRA